MSIPKIVLTGGACGGKTTAIRYLQKRLPDFGLAPFVIPELATQMFEGGFSWLAVKDDDELAIQFQTNMILKQLDNEDWYEEFAHNMPGSRKVLICDRGVLDNVAYITPHQAAEVTYRVWDRTLYTETDLKKRYLGIIHLTSLAFLEGYNRDNPARYETEEEARTMCDHIFETWSRGERRYHIRVPASVDLNVKVEQVAQHVVSIMEAHGY